MMSGLIIGPQIVVALLAPWVGYLADHHGRKPLLVVGMSLVAVRAGLFAFVDYYPAMIAIQLLDGISGATISVLTVLVITDLTTGTGRFNLTQGAIGAMNGTAAAALFTRQIGRHGHHIICYRAAAAARVTVGAHSMWSRPSRAGVCRRPFFAVISIETRDNWDSGD